MGLDGKKLEPESNVLLASIENMQYAVTLDVLHMVLRITQQILKFLVKSAFFFWSYSILIFSLFVFMIGVFCFWPCTKDRHV